VREEEKNIVRSFTAYTVFWIVVMTGYLSGFVKPNFLNLTFTTGFLLGFLKVMDSRADDYLQSLLHGSGA